MKEYIKQEWLSRVFDIPKDVNGIDQYNHIDNFFKLPKSYNEKYMVEVEMSSWSDATTEEESKYDDNIKHPRNDFVMDSPIHEYPSDIPLEPLISMGGNDIPQLSMDLVAQGEKVYSRQDAKCESFCYQNHNSNNTCLIFESRFESGCLDEAIRIGENEYVLVLQGDPESSRKWVQWFYFGVQNLREKVEYTFHLIHLQKKTSVFGRQTNGCLPLIYSTGVSNPRWKRTGYNLRYEQNPTKGYTLSFSFMVESSRTKSTHYFAPSYPYRYSDLQAHLASIEQDPVRSKRMKRTLLCKSTAGNRCDCLEITSPITETPGRRRRAIFFSARVHPAEANASWIMQGVIDFLVGPSLDAKILRDNFVFCIIPMLNPDGVMFGNTRSSCAGVDLNRMYLQATASLHPTVYHTRLILEKLAEDFDVCLYCDIHGHSTKHNVFMYGCAEGESLALVESSQGSFSCRSPGPSDQLEGLNLPALDSAGNNNNNNNKIQRKKSKSSKLKIKRKKSQRTKASQFKGVFESRFDPALIPHLLAEASVFFSYDDCMFSVQKEKESTGRVYVHRTTEGQTLSYTLEASLGGMTVGPLKGNHLNYVHFEQMGHALCDSLLDFTDMTFI